MMEEAAEPKPKSAARWNLRRTCVWVFIVLIAASAVAVRQPVMTTTVRAILSGTLLFGLFTAFLYLITFFSTRPRALYPAIFIIGLFVTWVVLGNKPPDVETLRDTYVDRLESFEGVPHKWGGEIVTGIDCSGLARAGLWQAMVFDGARTLNPRLLGPMLWKFWWHDVSARDMLDGKHGYTKKIGHANKLAGYDSLLLEKGDMAVTDDGVHVLIYYGDGVWAEANPNDSKVVVNKAALDSKRKWFNVPVTFVRWWILEEED